MRFTVTPPDRTARQVERGPQHVCHRGDELCAFYPNGPCTTIECTCHLEPDCASCRADFHRYCADPAKRSGRPETIR